MKMEHNWVEVEKKRFKKIRSFDGKKPLSKWKEGIRQCSRCGCISAADYVGGLSCSVELLCRAEGASGCFSIVV